MRDPNRRTGLLPSGMFRPDYAKAAWGEKRSQAEIQRLIDEEHARMRAATLRDRALSRERRKKENA